MANELGWHYHAWSKDELEGLLYRARLWAAHRGLTAHWQTGNGHTYVWFEPLVPTVKSGSRGRGRRMARVRRRWARQLLSALGRLL
jgi:hypothetical protein